MSAEQRFTQNWLQGLITNAEKELVEFKSEWYDLKKGPSKAKSLKSMLALGNSVSADKSGFLIVGVGDPAHRGNIRGLLERPQPEAVAQIVASLTMPPVRHDFHRLLIDTKSVDVIEIMFSPARPHFAAQGLPELRTDVAYIRRGATIGTMTPDELEAMYREKLGLASKGQYQGMVYQMVTDNQAGWAYPMAAPEP
jgi:predicted HTH transcriptional regulator